LSQKETTKSSTSAGEPVSAQNLSKRVLLSPSQMLDDK